MARTIRPTADPTRRAALRERPLLPHHVRQLDPGGPAAGPHPHRSRLHRRPGRGPPDHAGLPARPRQRPDRRRIRGRRVLGDQAPSRGPCARLRHDPDVRGRDDRDRHRQPPRRRVDPPGRTGAGADDASLVAVGQGLVGVRDWTFIIGPSLMPGFNALMFATVLYRSRLVPRLIPAMGLVGAPAAHHLVRRDHPRVQRARLDLLGASPPCRSSSGSSRSACG